MVFSVFTETCNNPFNFRTYSSQKETSYPLAITSYLGSSFAFAAEQNPPTRRRPSPSHDAGSLAPCRPAFLTPGTASLSPGAHFGGRPLLLFKQASVLPCPLVHSQSVYSGLLSVTSHSPQPPANENNSAWPPAHPESMLSLCKHQIKNTDYTKRKGFFVFVFFFSKKKKRQLRL